MVFESVKNLEENAKKTDRGLFTSIKIDVFASRAILVSADRAKVSSFYGLLKTASSPGKKLWKSYKSIGFYRALGRFLAKVLSFYVFLGGAREGIPRASQHIGRALIKSKLFVSTKRSSRSICIVKNRAICTACCKKLEFLRWKSSPESVLSRQKAYFNIQTCTQTRKRTFLEFLRGRRAFGRAGPKKVAKC